MNAHQRRIAKRKAAHRDKAIAFLLDHYKPDAEFPKLSTIEFFLDHVNSNIGRRPVGLINSDPDRLLRLFHAFMRPADVF